MLKSEKINIALAQIAPKLGDLKSNLEKHLHYIEKAKKEKADLVVFPELSLTGYSLKDAVYDVAMKSDDKFLNNSFKKIIKVIYSWRNQFVHEAQIPPFRETAVCGGVYKKNKKSPEKRIVVLLTTKELKPIFERMIKKHFDKYQFYED